MRRLIYLIGEPGIGKTTAMEALTGPFNRLGVLSRPTRTLFADRHGLILAVELGRRRATGYGGTDALPMNAVVAAEAYLRTGRAAAETNLLLGEGARLANARFLSCAAQSGWAVHLVYLEGAALAEARRNGRGSTQNESWVRGAATRARNLADHPPAGVTVHRYHLTGDESPADLAATIARFVAEPHAATLLWPAA